VESGTEGGKGAMGAAAAGRVEAEGGAESGTDGCKESSKGAVGAGAADLAGAEGCTESGAESCKEGDKREMDAAAAGRGGAIVVPAMVLRWSAAAAGAARACGASRVSNSREQASPGRNAHRAALGEHRLGLEAAGRAGGGAMGRVLLRARTETPPGWQQDGPWRGVPARLSRYPATGLERLPALGFWPIPRAGSGWELSGSRKRATQGSRRRSP
jgi:hypothetical protein